MFKSAVGLCIVKAAIIYVVFFGHDDHFSFAGL